MTDGRKWAIGIVAGVVLLGSLSVLLGVGQFQTAVMITLFAWAIQ